LYPCDTALHSELKDAVYKDSLALLNATVDHIVSQQAILNTTLPEIKTVSVLGEPRSTLIECMHEILEKFAETLEAGTGVEGIVVVGSRGLGPVSRAVFGSVSEHIVHHFMNAFEESAPRSSGKGFIAGGGATVVVPKYEHIPAEKVTKSD
jgi:nucleotide-binding universal stress UspA family protein